MKTPVPKLSLTHGQVLWSLGEGMLPDAETVDRIRYLRQLGVPFTKSELGTGRGHRLHYAFEQLIELAVALFALRRGTPPREIAHYLIEQRTYLRKLYRKALQDQPATAAYQPWVKSRGRIIPILGDELFLRIHDRYSEQPGKIEMLPQAEIRDLSDFFGLVERYPGDQARTLLPLTRLVLECAAWAKEAPDLRPGPSR